MSYDSKCTSALNDDYSQQQQGHVPTYNIIVFVLVSLIIDDMTGVIV